MNRGVLQSSLMQQMMGAENPIPNWSWNINCSPFLSSSPNLPFHFPSNCHDHEPQAQDHHLPDSSWSQLLLGGLVNDDEKSGCVGEFQGKRLEDWEEEILKNSNHQTNIKKDHSVHHAPPTPSSCTYVYGHSSGGGGGGGGGDDYESGPKQSWSQMMPMSSSPQSCVTSNFSSNMLDFSNNSHSSVADTRPPRHHPDRPSECNSNATGGAVKKARVQSSSSQTTFKVRKEKLGDRITALHQLVSPFGKTDTASVLLEAIGYIRFLQSQIEALSLPYLGNGSGSTRQLQHSVQGERNCVFPEDPGQLLNENCLNLKRKGVTEQDCHEEPKKDLRSRGLCLVPVSCTLQVGSDNGADYWAPAFAGGGGFR